ncbi:tetratricopeptide repeat protein [Thermomonospora amylolytica]|uniref:tetratricopeptide repeat protein n=1 Tax=Thermomonospora amylolytica TaxID=1411117 RepID=UPI000E6CA0B8|nr:SEL1-like repeat protein [Thermomonospora amylolytica]
MFRLYGQHGVRLLRAAEEHQDADACFRLGVLLCLEGCPAESLAWLMKAERHGHQVAIGLVEHPAPRLAAAGHAYELGLAAAVAGDRPTAEIYLERAVEHGHADAAFELGTLWMEDPARAVYWFTRAAQCGHRLGQWWADKIHADSRHLRPAPPSPRHHQAWVPPLTDLIERALNDPR